MHSARERILSKLRAARLREISADKPIDRASVPRSEHSFALFQEKARAAGAEILLPSDTDDLMSLMLAQLAPYGSDRILALAPHPTLEALPWPQQLHAEFRPAGVNDVASLSMAYAGIAETGSLVLLSGARTPTSLNFLTDLYLCLLPRARIVARQEDLWQMLRREKQPMPRALNLITGPSRTADVEQTIQIGAHGPRRVCICITQFPL